jgi:arabinose-5-phosphate isomerase
MQQQEAKKLAGTAQVSMGDDGVAVVAQVLGQEAESLNRLAHAIPSSTQILLEKIIANKGKVIFSGLGKSWLVAQKLAATFCGVGIPSFGLHGCDSLHGDLGVVQPQDLIIVLSKSANGIEFEYLFSSLRLQGNFTALICCCKGPLCNYADLVVQLPFDREACKFNLAPTSSSTITMAFGDALAIAASQRRGFTKLDFARYHPAGALGRRLLLTVDTLMHKGEALPFVGQDTLFTDLMYTISSKKLGVGIVVDEQQVLKGIITDGDLRRACEKGPSVFERRAIEFMSVNPKTIEPRAMAIQALEVMETYNITSLVVVDRGTIVGLIHIHDLIKAGIKG